MSLNTIPSHPSADSYTTLAEANALLANRSDATDWSTLTDDQKEALLKLATRQIDTLRFFGEPFFERPIYYREKQALKYPRTSDHYNVPSGVADSATATTLVDNALANNQNYPNDYFIGWAIVIKEGTGRGQTVQITDFDSTTGTVTVAAWSTTPDSTSQYMIVPKILDKVKNAVAEQALYLSKGGGERARMQAEGVTAYKIGDLSETFGNAQMAANKVAISSEAKGYLSGLISRLGKLI